MPTDTKAPRPGTPLPWRFEEFEDDRQTIIGAANGQGLAKTVGLRDPRDTANAAYIVHAANHYPELVEALQWIAADAAPGWNYLSDAARKALHLAGEGA